MRTTCKCGKIRETTHPYCRECNNAYMRAYGKKQREIRRKKLQKARTKDNNEKPPTKNYADPTQEQGRPKKVLKDLSDLEQVEYLAGYGLTIGEIADFFGMARSTFYCRIRDFPDMANRIKAGKTNAKLRLTKTAYDKALKGDNDMMKFLLSRVHGMTENINLNMNDDRDRDDLSESEILERIESLRRRNEQFQTETEQKLLESPILTEENNPN